MADLESLRAKYEARISGNENSNQAPLETASPQTSNLESLRTKYEEKIKQVPTMNKQSPIESLATTGKAIATETTRGLFEGSKFFTDTLSGAEKVVNAFADISTDPVKFLTKDFIDQKFGANNVYKNTEPTRIFNALSENTQKVLDSIPESGMDSVNKFIYNNLGATPGYAASYLVGRGLLKAPVDLGNFSKPLAEGLIDVGQFALVQALQEFDKDPDLQSFASGFAEGGTVGAAFPVASLGAKKVYEKTSKMITNFTKKTAEKWLTFLIKDEKLAKEYVNNPFKFDSFRDGKSSKELKEELNQTVSNIKTKHAEDIKNLSLERNVRKNEFINDTDESILKIKQKKNEVVDSIKERNKDKLTVIDASIKDDINYAQQNIQANVYDDLNNLHQKLVITKEARGKAVDSAIKNMTQKDPFYSLPTKIIDKRMSTAIKDSGFNIVDGKAVPKIGKLDQSQANELNAIIEQFNGLKSQTLPKKVSKGLDLVTGRETFETVKSEAKGISLDYLQNLKKNTYALANKYYKSGDTKLAELYSSISKAANPVNMLDDPKLAQLLEPVAKANKEYSNFIKGYDNYLKLLFNPDASKKRTVPNVDKVLRAIEKNDIAFINELKKAELALPPEDRILNNLYKYNSQFQSLKKEKISYLRTKRKLLEKERKEIQQKFSQEITSKQKEKKQGLQDYSIEDKKEAIAMKKTLDTEIDNITNELNKQIEQASAEETLSSLFPQGAVARRLQNIAEIGALGSLAYGAVDKAIKVGLAAGGLSPLGASLAIKSTKAVSDIVKRKLESTMLDLATPAAKVTGKRLKEVIASEFI